MAKKMNAFDMYKEFGSEIATGKELKFNKKSEGLENILADFSEFKNCSFASDKAIELYYKAMKRIEKIQYKIEDVEDFFEQIDYFKEHEEYNLFVYIDFYDAALVNKIGKEGDKFVFNVVELNRTVKFPMANIGLYLNGPSIEIHGWLLDVGFAMKKGNIAAHDRSMLAGRYMEGGEIIMYGPVSGVGECMKGGKIFLEGDYGCSIGENATGGEIYAGGKLIWPK